MNKDREKKEQSNSTLSTIWFIVASLLLIMMFFHIGYQFDTHLCVHHPDYISNENVWTWAKEALTRFALFVAIFIGGGVLYSQLPLSIKDRLWSFIDRNLKYAFIIVWVLGFVTYSVGTYVESPHSSFFWHSFSVVPMAIIHATEMFIGQSDISAIHSDRHENAFYMLFFNLSHFLAILCSMIFVLHQFGFYLAEEAKIGLNSLLAKIRIKRPKNLYIFWGISDPSLILAEDMTRLMSQGELNAKDTSIVFVRTFDDEESYNSNVGFKRVFSMVKMKNHEIDTLRHLHCRVTTSFHRLSKLIHIKDNSPILRHNLNLNALNRLIRYSTGEVHFLILNDDEDINIRCTNNLQKDSTVQYVTGQGRDVHIYCHARHSAKTRGLEIKDICQYDSHQHIHIIDSSRLSVFWLKDNVDYHPIKFVGIDKKTATVNTPFRAAIVGFGETGQEAFNFLYEFGAFVDENGNKTSFHCSIIDDNAKILKGIFQAKAPSLPDTEYKFYNYPVDSSVYWNILEREVKSGLSNLFITISDEELAIDAAVNFCNLAVRWIADEQKQINVYVRAYKHENIERLKTIRDELKDKYAEIKIVVFGSIHDLFTYDNIINDHYIQNAKIYNYAYSTGQVATPTTPEDEINKCWQKELKYARTKTDPTIWNVEDTERRRDQNISNALHAATRLYLLEQANKPADEKILLNLARLEHERWVAVSRLQGWQQTTQTILCEDNKQIRTKTHIDLVPWDDIRHNDPNNTQAQTQSYDLLVVKTTIAMAKDKDKEP